MADKTVSERAARTRRSEDSDEDRTAKIPRKAEPALSVLRTQEDFKSKIKVKDNKYKVINFHAKWCKPCLAIAPDFLFLAGEHSDFFEFHLLDVDENEEIADQFHVNATPTFIIFYNGGRIGRMVGSDLKELKEQLAALRDAPTPLSHPPSS
eukprot:m.123048 g.123048  ORF g.123048 m.123048 type:complete len:152 (-) comp52139_c0_seq1:165-620(-)